MDVYCATCQEPWDHHHMLHDIAWDVWDGSEDSSSHLLVRKFLEGPKASIPKLLREDLKESYGWVFGRTVVCILRCACCEAQEGDPDFEADDPEIIEERKQLRLQYEELLGDDLDGIISQMTSIDRFMEVG